MNSPTHLRLIAASASSKLGIMRRALLQDPVLVLRYYCSILLPSLEYCFPVWMSSVSYHFYDLDRAVSKDARLGNGLMVGDLDHRCYVTAMCVIYVCGNL